MKKVVHAVVNLFTRLFTGVIGTMRKFAHPAVLIVQALKPVIESDAATLVVALTKTKVDDILLAKARAVLPAIFNMMGIADECLGKGKSNDEIIQCGLAKIKLMHPEAQNGKWMEIAGHLSAALSDGRFTFGEMVGIAWLIYNKEVKPMTLAAA